MKTNGSAPGPHDLPTDLITVREAATLLQVNLATAYRYIADGRLPAWRRAHARLFVSRAAALGLFEPPANVSPRRVASHHESVEQLRKRGWM